MTTNVMVRDLDLRHRRSSIGGCRGRIAVDRFAVDVGVFPSQRRFPSQRGYGHRRRGLPSNQAAQRAEVPQSWWDFSWEVERECVS